MKIRFSRQWTFVIIWSAFVVLLANIPYIYGYSISPAGRTFMGDARCFIDTNTYIAWMQQASDGHFLFKDAYTTEPHQRNFFHPLFLLLGNISRISGLSNVAVHGLSRVLFGFLLLILCYRFLSLFIEGEFKRSVTFILVCLSGGFGWLNFIPAIGNQNESWFLTGWVEGNTFLSIYALPLFSASLIMLIATFLLMIRAFETRRMVHSVLAGIVAFFLIFTHFFDTLIVFPVLICYVLARLFISKDPEEFFSELRLVAVMFLVACPAAFYDYWASVTNPVFHEHAWKGAITLSPQFAWYLGGLGFVGIFCAFGLMASVFDETSPLYFRRVFLATWVLVVPFLVYMPIPFQRRLVEGVHVPVAILAALGFFFLIERFGSQRKFVSTLLVIAVIPASLFVLNRDMAYLAKNAPGRSMAGFLDSDILGGMEWLKLNTGRDDVVFCDFETGNYIPAISGNVVFIGHSPQTINFNEKASAVKAFFSADLPDETRVDILRASQAKYVFYSWKEASLGSFDPSRASYLKPALRRGDVVIYKVVGL